MLTKNTKTNSEEKAWLKAVADFHNDYGLDYLYGVDWSSAPFQMHHVCGRSYKQNKVKIGNWFILPVPLALHDVHSNHPLNVTHWRHRFTDNFGLQRDLWLKMVEKMKSESVCCNFPGCEVECAIMASKF